MKAEISGDLIAALETALGEAVEAVESEDVTKAGVTLAFGVALDEEGDTEISFDLKHAGSKKGSWRPGSAKQMRLFPRASGE